MIETDFLVIGSGIAGLTYAIKVANHFPNKIITVITKSDQSESNTKYAQGGIAVVLDEIKDSFEEHINDTIIAGDGLCNIAVVRLVIEAAPKRLKEIIDWGVEFDKDEDGKFRLGKEGGHSAKRILHHKDITGYEIEQALLAKIKKNPNIHILSHTYAVDLITEHHLGIEKNNYTCFGAYILEPESKKISTCLAKITMLATGGIGQVYRTSTNPRIATGDGIAMANRAKAIIKDMEFIQFHPTALYDLSESPNFLISEAIRGAGAYLLNSKGERFVLEYDTRAELASRDIVAQAIDSELKKSGENCVYLDCRHIETAKLKAQFPNIIEKCKSKGIDLFSDLIPVVPAAHYLCGGIAVDLQGRTSINNLYACGECSYTGLHGANRLASNSLLEALVFADNSYRSSIENIHQIDFQENIPEWNDEGTSQAHEMILIKQNMKELRDIMNDYVGIVRSNERLHRAKKRIDLIYNETLELYHKTKITSELLELRNMIEVAHLILEHSLQRKENRGGFYNIDLDLKNFV